MEKQEIFLKKDTFASTYILSITVEHGRSILELTVSVAGITVFHWWVCNIRACILNVLRNLFDWLPLKRFEQSASATLDKKAVLSKIGGICQLALAETRGDQSCASLLVYELTIKRNIHWKTYQVTVTCSSSTNTVFSPITFEFLLIFRVRSAIRNACRRIITRVYTTFRPLEVTCTSPNIPYVK